MSDIAILVDTFKTKKGDKVHIEKLSPHRLFYIRLEGRSSHEFKIKYQKPMRRRQILEIIEDLGYNKTCYIRQKNGT